MFGGVVFYESSHASKRERECFEKFAAKAHFSQLAQGTYGIAFQGVVSSPRDSCYVDPVRRKRVSTLLVKLSVLSLKNETGVIDGVEYSSITPAEFEREAEIQSKLFVESLNHFGRAVCPALVYAEARRAVDVTALLGIQVNADMVGVIAMEIVEGATSLLQLNKDRIRERQFRRLLLMAGELGVAHGDFHASNLLVDGSGDPYLIDFGNATRLNTATTAAIRAEVAAADKRGKGYGKALDLISRYGLVHDYRHDKKVRRLYAWLFVDDVAPPFAKLQLDPRWLRRAPTIKIKEK